MDKICHFRPPFLWFISFGGAKEMNKKVFKTKKVTSSLGELNPSAQLCQPKPCFANRSYAEVGRRLTSSV